MSNTPQNPRAALTDPRDIVANMAADLNELRREHGSVTQPQLVEQGWTLRQVREFFLRALEQASHDWNGARTAQGAPFVEQARPFIAFDVWMRDALAKVEQPLRNPDSNEVA